MTYKQIEAAREARLWIGQVIVPACLAATVAVSNPNVRQFASDKAKVVKNFIKNIKFDREEGDEITKNILFICVIKKILQNR